MLVSVTPSCFRTVMRHSHGLNRLSPPGFVGVNSHGKSGRSNSTQGKQFGSKSDVPGRGSVRTTWFASIPITSAGPRSAIGTWGSVPDCPLSISAGETVATGFVESDDALMADMAPCRTQGRKLSVAFDTMSTLLLDDRLVRRQPVHALVPWSTRYHRG